MLIFSILNSSICYFLIKIRHEEHHFSDDTLQINSQFSKYIWFWKFMLIFQYSNFNWCVCNLRSLVSIHSVISESPSHQVQETEICTVCCLEVIYYEKYQSYIKWWELHTSHLRIHSSPSVEPHVVWISVLPVLSC